jgi:hypothetical protein
MQYTLVHYFLSHMVSLMMQWDLRMQRQGLAQAWMKGRILRIRRYFLRGVYQVCPLPPPTLVNYCSQPFSPFILSSTAGDTLWVIGCLSCSKHCFPGFENEKKNRCTVFPTYNKRGYVKAKLENEVELTLLTAERSHKLRDRPERPQGPQGKQFLPCSQGSLQCH